MTRHDIDKLANFFYFFHLSSGTSHGKELHPDMLHFKRHFSTTSSVNMHLIFHCRIQKCNFSLWADLSSLGIRFEFGNLGRKCVFPKGGSGEINQWLGLSSNEIVCLGNSNWEKIRRLSPFQGSNTASVATKNTKPKECTKMRCPSNF